MDAHLIPRWILKWKSSLKGIPKVFRRFARSSEVLALIYSISLLSIFELVFPSRIVECENLCAFGRELHNDCIVSVQVSREEG